MLSSRTLCEASAIRFARIWVCVSRFMRSIARRMYSARDSRSACAHLLLVSIRSSIGPISQLLDTNRASAQKLQRVKLAMRQPQASRLRRLSGDRRVQPRATGSADMAGYCRLKRLHAACGPFTSFQPHQTTPVFPRTHTPVTPMSAQCNDPPVDPPGTLAAYGFDRARSAFDSRSAAVILRIVRSSP